ncbi:MAG: ChbG/HpnK family deacetylase [Acidimicrobiaceae bacterium]|nr:ChbG/HpnK family deacetylase [Acidimicrobiaceae bacterium]
MTALVEALGHRPDASLLIVTADELGVSYASNAGVYRALREGMANAAGLVVPGPWAREATANYRGEDVGVHLTLNAEYELYRWGPITHCPSLLDGDGGFPRTVEDLWEHADTDEVRRECRAQIERAVYWGFDVSHLSAHMAALELRPEFFDVALDLAVEFQLPLRLPPASQEHRTGFPFRRLAAEEGVVSPDNLVRVAREQGARRALDRLLSDLQPGVTEVVIRPAVDTAELRAVMPDWPARVDDEDLATAVGSLRALAERAGVTVIGYRELRDLQRSGAKLH